MLQNARLFQGVPDICFGDLNVAVSLSRIVEQDPVANNVRLSLGEIAAAPKTNQGTTVTSLGRNKQGEGNPNEEGKKALNYTHVNDKLELLQKTELTEKDPSPPFQAISSRQPE